MPYVLIPMANHFNSLDETGHVARNWAAWRMLELSSMDSAKEPQSPWEKAWEWIEKLKGSSDRTQAARRLPLHIRVKGAHLTGLKARVLIHWTLEVEATLVDEVAGSEIDDQGHGYSEDFTQMPRDCAIAGRVPRCVIR